MVREWLEPYNQGKIMKRNELPSLEYLQECFEYNAQTGELFWKVRPLHHFKSESIGNQWNGQHSGNGMTSQYGGHLAVSMNNIKYCVKFIIWKLHTGNNPKKTITHIDGNKLNNNITNLTESISNRKIRYNNVLGVKGVRYNKSSYVATITRNGVSRYIGSYKSLNDASQAYQNALESYLK